MNRRRLNAYSFVVHSVCTGAAFFQWRGIIAALLAMLLLGTGGYFTRLYRHDAFFRNEVALRLYALSSSPHDRKLLLIGDSNVGLMPCAGDFAGWRILKLGVAGARSGPMLGYIRAHAQAWPHFDAAILWIGINDLRFDQGNGTEVARNVLATLGELATVSDRLAVMRQAALPDRADAALSARVDREVVAMNTQIAEATRPKEAAVIAPFPNEAGTDPEDFESDGLHLDARGYARACAEAGRWLSGHE